MSKYTFGQKMAQRFENYKYTFNTAQFLYKNGLYIVIILIFIALCIITPIVKNTQLFTYTNILNILQQASPRMFLALGVAGLILLTGTDPVSYTHLDVYKRQRQVSAVSVWVISLWRHRYRISGISRASRAVWV